MRRTLAKTQSNCSPRCGKWIKGACPCGARAGCAAARAAGPPCVFPSGQFVSAGSHTPGNEFVLRNCRWPKDLGKFVSAPPLRPPPRHRKGTAPGPCHSGSPEGFEYKPPDLSKSLLKVGISMLLSYPASGSPEVYTQSQSRGREGPGWGSRAGTMMSPFDNAVNGYGAKLSTFQLHLRFPPVRY
jgi:hypothetical protein